MVNGVLSLNITAPAAVKIEMFDMRGKLLERALDCPASAGEYRFDVKHHPLAASVMLIRASVGERSSTFRSISAGGGANGVSHVNSPSMAGKATLAKSVAALDTLKVTASKYSPKSVAISSYQGSVNVTLDTLALEKFSFFVTSLKGLIELSGSQNGFGGNFSFGKTGQGAGLMGADSICQCLAEKSMPGSKVKTWRAFLSVAKDASGKQVNAVDRIGQGPWYDRLGRVLSPDIKGLLNTRPNADAAIKNDLPNENGVPNHRPDPTSSTQEDNHHFVTGSDTLGRLHSASETCADWTSVTASGQPRCGFAWPRPGMANAANWLSGFDAASCKAEVHVTTSMGGSGIGSNGGYGGFYCFALTP
jgi:hypothetical protein